MSKKAAPSLGICAGAYYACRELAFHAGTEGAICGPRGTEALWMRVAVGCLPELHPGRQLMTQQCAQHRCGRNTHHHRLTHAPITLYAHYHGGCRFDFGEATNHAAQILAVHTGLEGTPPAIVSAPVGKGCAILPQASTWKSRGARA
ncbi:BPL-N domain-containing protein [Cupriavidus basilensis]